MEFIKTNKNVNLEKASEFLLTVIMKSNCTADDDEDDFKALEVAEKLKLQLKNWVDLVQ